MSEIEPGSLTRLLRAHSAGERQAFDELVERVYSDLSNIARRQLRRASAGLHLDTVGLVHEAYARLVEEGAVDWQDRAHFFAVAARAMRFVVVDRARREGSQKRGGGLLPVTLDAELVASRNPAEVVLAVHQAIEKLLTFNERLARIVECRFFAGMTDPEIAAALNIGERTVQRDWMRARAWLREALSGAGS